MRPIVLARLEKPRPVVVLTREAVVSRRSWVTIAPITSTVRGLGVEVPVGPRNGLDHDCIVNCDNIQTVHVDDLGKKIGYLLPDQEVLLARAIAHAFDLPG